MNTKDSISKLERVLLLAFTSLAFAFFALGIFAEAAQSYNDSVVRHQNELARQAGVKNIISFASHGFDHSIPLFNLITFFIFLALIRPGRYIISMALTVLYLVFLVVSVAIRLDGRGALGSENFFTDPWVEFWLKTGFHDHFAAVVIVILLVWQGSILWRVYLAGSRNME